jgi:ankyrin repeat protein
MKRLLAFSSAVLLAAAAATVSANTSLIEAVKQQDRAAVRALLQQQNVDVNAADGDGSTALHWAAANGDVELTQALLKAGASVKPVTRIGGMSPLFMAARHGSDGVVGALLKAGANAAEANGNGTTVLMMAAASGNAATVKLLIDRGADVNATDVTSGQTALMFAAARNADAVIRLLLSRRAAPNVTTKVFKLERPRVDEDGNPLPPKPPGEPAAGAAGRRGGGERVHGATVIGGMTALHFAAREGHDDSVRALLDGGAGVNVVTGGEQTSVINEAIINGHLDLAKILLERGADPKLANIDGLTPLYATIDMRWRHNTWYPQPTLDEEQTNYLDFMRALLDRGADVNAPIKRKLWFRKFRYGDDWVEPNGATPFWRAAQANDVAAMRLLASRGADPTQATTGGVTPLMVAAGIGFEYQGTNVVPDSRLAAVKYLVDELRADVNAKDRLHYTTLHGAAYVGDDELITYLVSHGGDVRARAKGRLAGTQAAEEVPEGTGDTVADMANGPREKSLLHPGTVALVEKLGSENSHDCRSTACVNNTKAEKPPVKQQ